MTLTKKSVNFGIIITFDIKHSTDFISAPTVVCHLKKHINMKIIEVKKGQILQWEGDLNTKIFQVESGLLRSYSIDEKGKEHIYQFASENWIIADAIPKNKPCELFIDCLEDSVIIQTEKDFNSLDSLHEKLIREKETEIIEIKEKESIFNSKEDKYHFAEEIKEEETLSIHDKELELIKKALERNNGKRKAAAIELGISERTLYRKIKQHDIEL